MDVTLTIMEGTGIEEIVAAEAVHLITDGAEVIEMTITGIIPVTETAVITIGVVQGVTVEVERGDERADAIGKKDLPEIVLEIGHLTDHETDQGTVPGIVLGTGIETGTGLDRVKDQGIGRGIETDIAIAPENGQENGLVIGEIDMARTTGRVDDTVHLLQTLALGATIMQLTKSLPEAIVRMH